MRTEEEEQERTVNGLKIFSILFYISFQVGMLGIYI